MRRPSFKLRLPELRAAAMFLLCMDVDAINHFAHVPTAAVSAVQMVVCAFLFLPFAVERRPRRVLFAVTLLYGVFACSTLLFHSENAVYAARILVKPYLVALYCERYRRRPARLLRVLEVWKRLLLALCTADLALMLLFPDGVYSGDLYSDVGFLGYKTARIAYSLPMVVLCAYLPLRRTGRTNGLTWFSALIAIAAAYRSEAVAGTAALVLLTVLLATGCALSGRVRYVMTHYSVLLLGYGAAFSVLFFWSQTPAVQFIVRSVFGKSATLSGRIPSWTHCLDKWSARAVPGLGVLTPENYVDLMRNRTGTNAHSLLLSILVSGGLIALAAGVLLLVWALRRSRAALSRAEFALACGVAAVLVLGITSSAYVFSTFSLMFFVLLADRPARSGRRR